MGSSARSVTYATLFEKSLPNAAGKADAGTLPILAPTIPLDEDGQRSMQAARRAAR